MSDKLDQIEQRITQLQAQRKQLLAREKSEARKQRTHALIVFGGLIERACGGDWTAIDPDRLARILESNADVFGRCSGDSFEPKKANARIRAFESKSREEECGS